ncbi:MAG: hypothetical protein H5T65_10570 [Chloroflexi bacterium]|nr:hypothetical protein [Chloroflexota bacterium]
MRVHRYVLPFVFIAVLLGSVQVAKVAGYWSTSGKTVVRVDASGQADPADIKGWMTLAQVSELYGIPKEELWARLNLPADLPADTALKDVEKLVPDFETSAVRDAVAAYRAEQPDSAPLPSENAPVAKPSGEGEATPTPVPPDAEGTSAAVPSTEEIKGKNTLAEIADMYGIPVERLVAESGLPADVDTKTQLKDITSQYGIELLAIREAVDRILAAR